MQYFLQTKARSYHEGKVSAIFIVKEHQNDDTTVDGSKILAYFTLSMAAIQAKKLEQDEHLAGYTPISYPAVRLGQMGVDKPYRGQRLGQEICKFCVGLAATISERIACRYIILDTKGEDKVKYYSEKCEFRRSPSPSSVKQPNPEENVQMYRRLSKG